MDRSLLQTIIACFCGTPGRPSPTRGFEILFVGDDVLGILYKGKSIFLEIRVSVAPDSSR